MNTKHSVTIVVYSLATLEQSIRRGKHRKGFKTLAWPIKHPSKSYFLFSSTPFSHPPAWQIKRSEWLVGASTPGWRRWGSPPGAPQLPSTNSLIHGDLLGTPLAARNPLRLIFPFPLARRRRPAGRVDMWTDIFNNTCPPPGAGHAIWVWHISNW